VTPASMVYTVQLVEKERGLAIGRLHVGDQSTGRRSERLWRRTLFTGYGWQWMFFLTGRIICSADTWVLLVKNRGAHCGKRRGAVKGTTSWGGDLSTPVMWGACLGRSCYMYFIPLLFCMTWNAP